MKKKWCAQRFFLVLLTSVTLACQKKLEVPRFDQRELLPAGSASIHAFRFDDLMSPAGNLPIVAKPDFYAGKALANQPWVKAPSITDARDGLGPLFNARSCLACHQKGGKAKLPERDDELLFGPLVRLSIPAVNEEKKQPTEADASESSVTSEEKPAGQNEDLVGEPTENSVSRNNLPEPIYGEQLQTASIGIYHQLRSLKLAANAESLEKTLPAEADIYIEWELNTYVYPDGTTVELRKPKIRLKNLGYGAMHADVQISLRNAPAIAGMGLLEAVSSKDILAKSDPEDKNADGISGRANWVWDQSASTYALGRFGLKANRASLLDTVASAFASDLGLSNPIYPKQPCTEKQSACLERVNGNNSEGFELPMKLLTLTNDFIRNIALPARNKASNSNAQEGRTLFYKLQCSGCHTPRYRTEELPGEFDHLSEQIIWPYSDMLLHDMGEALADNRPDYEATGSEWRTAPLWGLSLNKKISGAYYLLHDGRARSVEEAILWHGGEAEQIKKRFTHLSKLERASLIEFVETL